MIEGLITAAALLLSGVDEQAVRVQKQQLLAPTRAKWLALGVLHESEDHYFRNPDHLDTDNGIMGDRHSQMKPDCPGWEYHLNFDRDFAMTKYRESWRSLILSIQLREFNLWAHHADDLNAIQADSQWRYEVWDCLSNLATRGYWNRRLELQRLRGLIGQGAFDRMEFPDPVTPALQNFDDTDFTLPEDS